MNYIEASKVLASCGQEHLLAYWKKLSKKEQSALLGQIAAIDPKDLKRCREALGKGGDVILSTAKKVLAEEYPELEGKMEAALPDEKFRRVGQSMAAASLPELK